MIMKYEAYIIGSKEGYHIQIVDGKDVIYVGKRLNNIHFQKTVFKTEEDAMKFIEDRKETLKYQGTLIGEKRRG